MADFGLNYDLASLKGYAALQRRFQAMHGTPGKGLMHDLGMAANRVQKQYLYTQAVHRRTGQSGRQITVAAATALSVTTLARGTAAWADTGTRPHIIRPRNKKVLAWGGARRLSGSLRSGSQADHFATIVHHPGTKSHPYMFRGAAEAVRQVGLKPIVEAWNGAA